MRGALLFWRHITVPSLAATLLEEMWCRAFHACFLQASQAGLCALGKPNHRRLFLLFSRKVSHCIMGNILDSNYMQVGSTSTKPFERDRIAGALRVSVLADGVQKTLQQIVSIGIIR